MRKFKIPKIPTTESKSIRFPIDMIENVENAIVGKSSNFSEFVREAVKYVLNEIEGYKDE